MPSSTRIRPRRFRSARDDAAIAEPDRDGPVADDVGDGTEVAEPDGDPADVADAELADPVVDLGPGAEQTDADTDTHDTGTDADTDTDLDTATDLDTDAGVGTDADPDVDLGPGADAQASGAVLTTEPVRRGLVGRNPGVVLAAVLVVGLAVVLSVRQLTLGDASTQASVPLPTLPGAAGPATLPTTAPTADGADAQSPGAAPTAGPTATGSPTASATALPSALTSVLPTYSQQTQALQAAAGGDLLTNADVTVTPAARAELASGRVDTNLVAVLATAVRQTPVTISSFATAGTDAPGSALRQATVAAPDDAGTQALRRVFAAQTGGYAVQVLGSGPGGTVVRVAGGGG